MDEKSSNQYCQDLVRNRDYHRYLLSFFVPRPSRPSLLAILALNVELQSIPDKATDPMVALVRLQWWRDEITKIYEGDTAQSSPILPGVQRAISRHSIPKGQFEALFHCYDDIIRGTAKAPDDCLYDLLSDTLPDDKTRNAFSRKLQIHDCLDDDAPFRAIRLWLGV